MKRINVIIVFAIIVLFLSACNSRIDSSSKVQEDDLKDRIMDKIFETFYNEEYAANYYLLANKGEGVLIDAGGCYDEIVKYVKSKKIKLKYIYLTHGHYDHIEKVSKIKEVLGSKTVIHKADNELFKQTSFSNADVLLEGGEVYIVGGMQYEFIHTPGHTPGSISIVCEDKVFSGDTLFKSSIGRTDLEGGSFDDIIYSIKEKLMKLDGKTTVYPGHGEKTSIDAEKKDNPFIN